MDRQSVLQPDRGVRGGRRCRSGDAMVRRGEGLRTALGAPDPLQRVPHAVRGRARPEGRPGATPRRSYRPRWRCSRRPASALVDGTARSASCAGGRAGSTRRARSSSVGALVDGSHGAWWSCRSTRATRRRALALPNDSSERRRGRRLDGSPPLLLGQSRRRGRSPGSGVRAVIGARSARRGDRHGGRLAAAALEPPGFRAGRRRLELPARQARRRGRSPRPLAAPYQRARARLALARVLVELGLASRARSEARRTRDSFAELVHGGTVGRGAAAAAIGSGRRRREPAHAAGASGARARRGGAEQSGDREGAGGQRAHGPQARGQHPEKARGADPRSRCCACDSRRVG